MVKLAVSNVFAIFGGSGGYGKTTTTATTKTNTWQKGRESLVGYRFYVCVKVMVVVPFFIKAQTLPPPHVLAVPT